MHTSLKTSNCYLLNKSPLLDMKAQLVAMFDLYIEQLLAQKDRKIYKIINTFHIYTS